MPLGLKKIMYIQRLDKVKRPKVNAKQKVVQNSLPGVSLTFSEFFDVLLLEHELQFFDEVEILRNK